MSIPSSGASHGTGACAGGGATAVALQAQLTGCERQLGDWEACASSKTPEGRKIIENLRARIGTLESKIASSGKEADPAGAADTARPVDATGAMRWANQSMGSKAVGSLLNVFA